MALFSCPGGYGITPDSTIASWFLPTPDVVSTGTEWLTLVFLGRLLRNWCLRLRVTMAGVQCPEGPETWAGGIQGRLELGCHIGACGRRPFCTDTPFCTSTSPIFEEANLRFFLSFVKKSEKSNAISCLPSQPSPKPLCSVTECDLPFMDEVGRNCWDKVTWTRYSQPTTLFQNKCHQ